MDILKSAIDLMSSKKEDPKPQKPLTASDLKNFAHRLLTILGPRGVKNQSKMDPIATLLRDWG